MKSTILNCFKRNTKENCGYFPIETVTNVTRSFHWGPNITSEIHYIEYSGLYESVIKNCHANLIIEAAPSSPFVAKFYGVNVDYVLSDARNGDQDGIFFVDTISGKYKTVWGELPVITDLNDRGVVE